MREVSDEAVEKVRQKVLNGMGLIVLHSDHASKIFRSLMGTNTGELKWRDDGEKERIWVIETGHRGGRGVPQRLLLPERQGKVFYFRPGHETFPVYHQPEVLQVISNR